jgi:hypothetical protein
MFITAHKAVPLLCRLTLQIIERPINQGKHDYHMGEYLIH